MAQNNRTPAGANGRGSGNGVASQADTFQIAPEPHEIQMRHLARRYGLSPAIAAALATHAYGVCEGWGGRSHG